MAYIQDFHFCHVAEALALPLPIESLRKAHEEFKAASFLLDGTLARVLSGALGKPISDLRLLSDGNSERTFRFKAANAELVATVFALPGQNIYGATPEAAKLRAETAKETHDFFQARQYPNISVPKILTFSGKPWIELNDVNSHKMSSDNKLPFNVVMISEFLPGRPFASKSEVCEADCYHAGQALAVFHLAHPKAKKITNVNSVEAKLDLADNLLSSSISAPLLSSSAQRDLSRSLALANELRHNCKPLLSAQGWMHNDFTPSNALENNGKLSMLDFGEASDGSPELDVAISLLNWTVKDKKPSQSQFNAFVSGYTDIRPLSSRTLVALPDMVQLAAFRWGVIKTELNIAFGIAKFETNNIHESMQSWRQIRPFFGKQVPVLAS